MQGFSHRALCRPLAGGLLAALLLVTLAVRAESSTATVPVSLDHALLRYLLVQQLFNTPDGTRDALDDPKGCNRILLSDPRIGAREEDLEIVTAVQAQLGLDVFGKCLSLIQWQGSAGFLGRPLVQGDGRSIKLEPQETWLINSSGSTFSSGWLWEAGNKRLMSLFGSFVLDLTPYVTAVGDFLPDVLAHRTAEQLQQIADSLALSDIRVTPGSLDVSINFAVEAVEEPTEPDTALTAEELAQLQAQWQMMDALLVGAVKHYAAATQLQALRDELLDILIESRYRLRDALAGETGSSGDAVRDWFVESWHSLGPVVRRIARDQPGQEQLLWFSTLTATDALYALDQLGPAIGLDISTAGLRRLARMISAGQVDEMLRYSEDVDPDLQRLLREEMETDAPEPSAWRINFSFFPRAWAATPGPDLNQWLPSRDKLGVYLPKIAALLGKTTEKTLEARKLERKYSQVYEKLVLATAWQESCWRQFVVINKRIEPLRSSSGDVGLMQVNERVWRGFYDLQKLRWDIDYNSRAGAEILFDYLVRHAIKRGEQKQPGGIANLARATYSAYNGGPGQVTRYRKSDVPSAQRKIDKLFWEKYRQVDAGKQMNVANCLGKELAGPA